MSHSDLIPAAALTVSITLVLLAAQLLPFGTEMLLVRIPNQGLQAALTAAGSADAVLVSIPAPGFAVLYGDASQVRRAAGLAARWTGGSAQCPSKP